ncbi:prephenate dehydratase [Gordonia jinhuaensis]|uniref:Prephenate dehydratase n=1 Tax=Gordonia jinhuaensis TaxID=1517702 RepID=A0A916TFB5_9ACTN|nr:prephenate dehydratase [Gordonia jinhuaensis]GGB43187.1 prephenate dehydratase [Gordonia jinhuaensis]
MSTIAFFGPSGTFTEMALDAFLTDPLVADQVGAGSARVAASSPESVIEMVRDGAAEFGVVPIESSVEGSVPSTMDALAKGTRVQIVAETVLPVAFTIAAATALDPAQVQTLAAYPVAARQVRHSVAAMFPAAHFVPADSNAGAADDVRAGRADAAVTTGLAASMAGLVVLADRVADSDSATTRFVLLRQPGPVPLRTGSDRTSVVLDLPHEPGSLMRAMSEFASRGIDLTRIESRPQPREGEYFFFLDAVGHIEDPAVAEALAALHAAAREVVYLGSWPTAVRLGPPPPDHRDSLEWVESLRRGGR